MKPVSVYSLATKADSQQKKVPSFEGVRFGRRCVTTRSDSYKLIRTVRKGLVSVIECNDILFNDDETYDETSLPSTTSIFGSIHKMVSCGNGRKGALQIY